MFKKVLLLAFLIYITQSCTCGDFHAFNRDTFTCEKHPTPYQDGYVEGCRDQNVQGINKLQWYCYFCKPQHVIRGGGKCVDTGIPGCKYAKNKQANNSVEYFLPSSNNQKYQCDKCDENNYYLHEDICVKNPIKGEQYYIEGCEQYWRQGQCMQCQKGYSFSDFKCQIIKQQIPNCIRYYDQICQECVQGYVTDKVSNKCIKNEEAFKNCQDAYFAQGNFQCQKCKPGYFKLYECLLVPTTERNGKIDNCVDYYYQNTQAQILCSQCDNEYSLSSDQKSCEIQKIKINNCLRYENQECVECDSQYGPKYYLEKIDECKKCPTIPKHQLNQEYEEANYQEQYGSFVILNNILKVVSQIFDF